MGNLFEYTLKKLETSFVTKGVVKKINNDPSYDRVFGEKICNIMLKMCDNDMKSYDNAIKSLVNFSLEFLELQSELEKTGSYKCKSFEEARKKVYDNPDVMENRYLNGLLLSQAFWINHYKMWGFFIEKFCNTGMNSGDVLEVPTGTGFLISEFIRNNNVWDGTGYDLSKSSVEFSKKLVKMNNQSIRIEKENVFDIPKENKYDRIICGELLEHLENPKDLLTKLKELVSDNGRIFLSTAIWAASPDHIYLFKNAEEVREMIIPYFNIKKEIVLNVFDNKSPEDEKTPINYACILS
ncbi:methyltransferase domain-containing protein, partial [Candidatus Woesearchaeota archaeon]|nr:methyltransferase domain-containing protein [Candidatus Woesearchaeota archaeon]